MRMRRNCFEASQNAFCRSALLQSRILPRRLLAPASAPVSIATTTADVIVTSRNSSELGVSSHDASPSSSQSPGAPTTPLPDVPRCLTIITGASRGLGSAIARVLAANGPPLPAADPAANRAAGGGTWAPGAGGMAAVGRRCNPSADASASESIGATPWIHDLVLLATDSVRLRQFVREELDPILEQQHQHQHQHHSRGKTPKDMLESQTTGARSAPAAAAAPIPTADMAVASRPSMQPRVAAADLTSPSASSPTQSLDPMRSLTVAVGSAGSTRVRALCFDLGDLEGVEANTARLLSHAPEPSVVVCSSSSSSSSMDAGSGRDRGGDDRAGSSGGGGGGYAPVSRQCLDGSASASGLLPLPPSAYTHVLLVHNAGQVGDLAPLEQQGLPNIRRQTDLNVTSFTHLTAAVLRTFMHTPVVAPPEYRVGPQPAQEQLPCQAAQQAIGMDDEDAVAMAAAPLGAAAPHVHATSGCSHVGSATTASGAASPSGGGALARRMVTIVNISSVSVDQPYEHFSLYGMGKAARHMIIRSVAHEAALREADAPAAEAEAAAAVARVRALSFAPGAIDTEMQTSARKALPDGPLKARFEDNARSGRLVDPRVSAQVLYDILVEDSYDNGAHMDYYTATAGGAGHPFAAHPLARRG